MTTEATTEPVLRPRAGEAKARAEESRAAAGLPPRRRTEGPFAEMLAEAGFSAEAIRSRGENFRANFCASGSIGEGVMSEADTLRFVDTFGAVADALEAGTHAVVDGLFTEVAAEGAA